MTRPAVWFLFLALAAACETPPPADRIRASGHVEATETRLAPEQGGRILTFPLKEGDRVQTGQVLLTLDRKDLELQIARARADQAQAEAQLRLVQAGSRVEDVRQAESQVAAAQAEVSAANAELRSADDDLQRFEMLLASNSGSRKQRDDAATRKAVAADRVAAAESRMRAQADALARLKAGARREEIDVARTRVVAAATQIAVLEKNLADTTFSSPVTGVVTEKLVEPGEVIAPRTPIAVVVDLDSAWADVFVAEPAIPGLRLGQAATVFTDAGGTGIPGTITYISPKAEFTPRNVQTAEERSKLVYRVRISADNKSGVLKQGMPVEADIPLQQP
jgi:HlyD family secretion protein